MQPLLRHCGLQHEVSVLDGKPIIRLGFIIKAKNCADKELLNSTFGAATRANMDETTILLYHITARSSTLLKRTSSLGAVVWDISASP
jgi:hypothetical protein